MIHLFIVLIGFSDPIKINPDLAITISKARGGKRI